MKPKVPRWKVALLGGLVVLGAYLFYSNVIADPDNAQSRQPGAAASHTAAVRSLVTAPPVAHGPVVRASSRSKSHEGPFHPSIKNKPEDAIDPMQVDPTLRTDLLAKVQAVELETSARNPFQFGMPPPPPLTAVQKEVLAQMEARKNAPPPPPKPAAALTPAAPAGPPPLNLQWKYFGYSSVRGNGQKKAFFLITIEDGEDILTANEGDVLQKKFRVVRIGVNSVVMEDITTKSQQTLPLQEEPKAAVAG